MEMAIEESSRIDAMNMLLLNSEFFDIPYPLVIIGLKSRIFM